MIRLHHCPQTRSMRSLWLLHELGVPFETVEWPFDRALRSPEFLALNPVGRVPAVEMDGRSYWETGAITEILCERFPDAGLGREPGHPERADWLIWLHFSETISTHAQVLTQQHVMLREEWMRSPVVMKLEAARLDKCYDAIERGLAGDWLLAGGFSAADVSIAQAVYMARHFARIGERPRLRAWFERCTAREGYRASLPEAGGALYPQAFFEPPEVVPPEGTR